MRAVYDPTCRPVVLPPFHVNSTVDARVLGIQLLLSEKGAPYAHVAGAARAVADSPPLPRTYFSHDILGALGDLVHVLAEEAKRASCAHDSVPDAVLLTGSVAQTAGRAIARCGGPYLLGAHYTACDTLLLPYLHSTAALSACAPMVSLAYMPLLRAWQRACRSRPAVQRVFAHHRITPGMRALPLDLLHYTVTYLHTPDVLLLQEVSQLWRRVAKTALAWRLPVFSQMLPCEVACDGWRLRVGYASLRISGRGYRAECETRARWMGLSKLLAWMEGLVNPTPPCEILCPPGAPGGDRRQFALSVTGPALLAAAPVHHDFTIDLAKCQLVQRTAALSLRNWLLVVEELPGSYPTPLDGLSLCADDSALSEAPISPTSAGTAPEIQI